ncbi:SEC-C domain-containing protein [Lactococcus lactis]|uniref:SEC-C metal-binding domain-containing protein n=1 Tax=Lactococcus lactis TaxID=1358 RepID=UPI001F3ADD94|nr:SEC-C metal-binding domain-containing protein [Lactococcus lactis]MCG0999928.1 SEC-C domain-containing protein [Lactococcus lactis]
MIELSQVKNIFNSYDGINLISFTNEKNSFIVLFNFDANVSINGANFFIDYKIHLEVPKNYPAELPIVFESGEKRVNNFPHINPDRMGTFCLGTELDIRKKLKPDYSLSKYIPLIAEFLGIYEYYNQYSIFPYGDRNHGKLGILETYKEIFNVTTNQQVANLMQVTKLKNKSRNQKCPCNSGIKFKNCHWDTLSSILSSNIERTQIEKDYILLKGG